MKYQSQFVPTNFSGIGNVLGMYRQDLQQRDKDFDEGVMFQNEALAQLGSLQSEDLEGKQQRINAITTAMDEVAKKHGGDYAKASKDLYRLVAQEKANPWYQMNNKLNEAVSTRRKLGLDADNIVIGGDIRTVADAQKAVAEGRDPFNVSAIKKSNVYDTASKIFTNFADQLTSNSNWKNTLGGQYFERMQKFGQRPEDIEGFLSTGEGKAVMDSIIREYPQLAQASDTQLRNVIKQAAYSAVGKDVVDTQANRGYESPSARRSASEQEYTSQYVGTPTTEQETFEKVDNEVRKDLEKINSIFGTGEAGKRNIVEPKKKTTPFTVGLGHAGQPITSPTGNTEGFAWDAYNKYKNKYSGLYKNFKDANLSDEEFIQEAARLAIDEATVLSAPLRYNNEKFVENIPGLVKNSSKAFVDDKNRPVKYKDYAAKFKDSGETPGQKRAIFLPDGRVRVKDPEGNNYYLNTKELNSDVFKKPLDMLEKTYKNYYNYSVGSEDIKKIDKYDKQHLSGNTWIGVKINPDDIRQRVIVKYEMENGEYIPKRIYESYQDFQQDMLRINEVDFEKTRRAPKADTENL